MKIITLTIDISDLFSNNTDYFHIFKVSLLFKPCISLFEMICQNSYKDYRCLQIFGKLRSMSEFSFIW